MVLQIEPILKSQQENIFIKSPVNGYISFNPNIKLGLIFIKNDILFKVYEMDTSYFKIRFQYNKNYMDFVKRRQNIKIKLKYGNSHLSYRDYSFEFPENKELKDSLILIKVKGDYRNIPGLVPFSQDVHFIKVEMITNEFNLLDILFRNLIKF